MRYLAGVWIHAGEPLIAWMEQVRARGGYGNVEGFFRAYYDYYVEENYTVLLQQARAKTSRAT